MKTKLKPGINDLQTMHPHTAAQWHPYKNGRLTPKEVCAYSGKKVWWQTEAERYGKLFTLEWDAVIANRANGCGCPYTSKPPKRLLKGFNDFQSTNPQTAALWHKGRNGDTKPDMIFEHTNSKYWWSHVAYKDGKEFVHEWEAMPRDVSVDSCPYCHGTKVMAGFNDLASVCPEIAEQWDTEANGRLTARDVSSGSNQYAWWSCSMCGYKWRAVINNRSRGTGCPRCAVRHCTSYPEQALYFYIRQAFPGCRNRDTETLDGLELDLYLPEENIAIEYNGLWAHSFRERKLCDARKLSLCREKNILLIRICETRTVNRHVKGEHLIECVADGTCEYLTYVMECLCGELSMAGCLPEPIRVNLEQDRQRIYAQYCREIKSKSLGEKHPELLEQWDYEGNGNLSPYAVYACSSVKICWRHSREREGKVFEHRWQSTAAGRSKEKRGCPICAGKIVQAGFNDLETVAPDFLNEWDYEKNECNPREITAGSSQRVHWKHTAVFQGREFLHAWKATVKSRMQGNGCPVCDSKRILSGYNDIATTHAELMKEWDYERNQLKPSEISYGYDKKVWWKHTAEKDGKEYSHSWQASPNSRTNRTSGCPYCGNKKVLKGYNDLESCYPEIAEKWDRIRNAPALPDGFTSASARRVYWTDRVKPVKISDRTKYIRIQDKK